jgi:sugar transferase (PEP-CTERM/EpsH1 system associated)
MKRTDAASRQDSDPGYQAKRILVLTPQLPYPPQQGTTIRNYNLIAGLAQRHEVHLLSFGNPDEGRDTPLGELCHSLQMVRPPQRSMRHRLKGILFSRLPDMAQRLPSAKFEATLAAVLHRQDLDVVEVEGIELAQYLFQVARSRGDRSRPLLVFDDHNAEYVLQQRAFETDARMPRRWAGAAYSFVQWRRLQGYERSACLIADRVVAVSEADAGALRRLVPGLEPVVVPNGVDMAYYAMSVPPLEQQTGPSTEDLVFTGKMDFRPNVDAVLWFAREVLPRIRQEAPEVRLWVVGKDPHPRLAPLLTDPAVVLTGLVGDVRPYIAGAPVCVIPLRIGGGTRLKVLEAMAMGKAIVSTALGCEGLDLVPGQELIIADEPADFAAAVLSLLRDPERRERLGRAARRFAGSQYDWRIIVPRLERVYET